jgi:hypothetical protein
MTGFRVATRLFHYTTRAFALECAADMEAGRPVLVEIWDGLYGPGFYALDVGFEDATREELRWECFGEARPGHPIDGALVLDPSLADAPFELVDGHIWLMAASWGSRAAIEGLIVAVGAWDRGVWRKDEYE